MTDKTWPRGAEWRKWDLHVHSPASANFIGDWPGLIIQLGNADCDVIGINDYFSVAGYRQILQRLHSTPSPADGNVAYREALEKLKKKTLLPIVECRMTNVLVDKNGSGTRINFHLIFDPAVDPENIETFIKGLSVKGASIGQRYADNAFLLNDVEVDFNSTCKILRDDGNFRDKFLIWLPYDEYGGIDKIDPKKDKLLKEDLICNADVLGSANAKQAEFFLWKDPAFTEDQYREWFKCRKPCIKGSDSHTQNEEIGKLKDHKSQPINKHCWIKADPTFNGLCQIINEPEDRVFIGALPPKLETVHDEPTRFIDRLVIRRTEDADTADTWFDCEIPLSADLVAIIGNKGSGKSALADIIGLAGNAQTDVAHFSFLTKNRFCERNGRLAKQFEVKSVWADGTEKTIALNGKADPNAVELVRYIPQTYLEKVCTETEPGEESEFQLELRKVIFSHISPADRLGKETLNDLIAYKTEELKGQINILKRDVQGNNQVLVRLEAKASPAHRAQLQSALNAKKQELRAHEDNKPAEVKQPDAVSEEQKAAIDAIGEKLEIERSALVNIEAQTTAQKTRQVTLNGQLEAARKLEGKLENLETEFKRVERDTEADLRLIGLAFADVATLTLNKTIIADKRKALAAEKALVDESLTEDNPNGLVQKRYEQLRKIKALQDQLDEPNKLFQEFAETLRAWDQKGAKIKGRAAEQDTLLWLEAQLAYIENELPAEMERTLSERRKAAELILERIGAIRDVYKELFSSVQDLISNSVIIKEGFKLTFESRISERSFQKDFLEGYVTQGNAGSFYSKDRGATLLEELRADVNFDDKDQTIGFVETILNYLRADMRSAQRPPMNISSQLRRNVDLKGLYDFLWSFDYLEPEYSLKLDGKDLNLLSPGERGTLLLVFYLLVDKSNKPIVVDQPEENLDSQTVYGLLRPVIKDVKKRRQIIMVTHSPNIAVVCDSEQIIHACIDRADGNRVNYTTGAIESPAINRFLVNVLEGTRPAFDNRESKYYTE